MPDDRLRILQILRAPTGGLWRHAVDLATGLAQRGHEVGLVMDSKLSDAQTEQRLLPLAPHLKLGLHRMPIARVAGASDIYGPFVLRRLARSLGVQVLHGHGAKGGYLARLARDPRRGHVAFYTPHGGVLHFDARSAAGMMFGKVERALMPRTDGILFESAFALRSFEMQFGKPACFSPVIHNGLSDSEFSPVGTAPDAVEFAFIGEQRQIKGVDLLLEALPPVKTPAGVPARIALAGDGPQRGEFEARAQELGLADRARFLGIQPARQVLANGRCLVVPSRAESLPYVILEAVAAQKPVIATNVGGIPEIFGSTAENLIPAGDVGALRNAMQAFLDNPEHAEAQARERYEYARDRFSVDHMVSQIEAAYRQALARN